MNDKSVPSNPTAGTVSFLFFICHAVLGLFTLNTPCQYPQCAEQRLGDSLRSDLGLRTTWEGTP